MPSDQSHVPFTRGRAKCRDETNACHRRPSSLCCIVSELPVTWLVSLTTGPSNGRSHPRSSCRRRAACGILRVLERHIEMLKRSRCNLQQCGRLHIYRSRRTMLRRCGRWRGFLKRLGSTSFVPLSSLLHFTILPSIRQ